jgi:CubicO group peptidase (beta-lactamase class C family)
MEKRSDIILSEKLDKLINESLIKRVFSACSVGFFVKNKDSIDRDIFNYGLAGEDSRKNMVDGNTFFDLASLTKPLVTSLCVLALIQEGKLGLEDKAAKFFARDVSPLQQQCTLFHLLTHSSGFPAHKPYYKKLVRLPLEERMERVTEWIFNEKLLFSPGSDNLYSDLGFILLGRIVEKVSGESLDSYWQRKIIKPMGLDNGLFFTNKRKPRSAVYVGTGECGWSKTELYGRVHDDNCRALGGVAGHAGVFGKTATILALCENIFLQYRGKSEHPSYSCENLKKVLDIKKGSWRFGFDTPAASFSSSGKYFSEMSIGHLGFTGTSFWLDMTKGIGIVFLTNRVFCGDDLRAIKRLRPLVHDTIMEEIIKKSG